jgi:N-acetylmuramoyl-L-alanine amidase
MGSRYLTDLATVMRRTGYPVHEVDGWQNRARGSGGYDSGRPNHIMAHHTASGASSDGWPDVNYCTFNDEDAPLCNLYVDRSGEWYVCAAGATNTNGSGHDPCGVTADDSMNSSAIGIEAGNNGTGEQWPDKQLDSYEKGCRELSEAYGIPISCIHAHWEWAPSRKSDPAGGPKYQTGSPGPNDISWNMDEFRSACQGAAPSPGPTPPTPTPEEDIDMAWRVGKRQNGAYFIGDGNTSYWVSDDGGDINMEESLCRMAPGAVNVVRIAWDAATDENAGPSMVTNWKQVKNTMQDNKIKQLVGKNSRIP